MFVKPCTTDASTPYFPIRLLLRDLLGVADGTDPAEVAGQLLARIEPNAPELVPWLPLLGIPMDFWMEPTSQTAQLEEQFRKARVEQVTAEFLSWVLPNPTLFVFEDVHWMDDASAELLHRLAAAAERAPWLILITRREADAGFIASGHATVSLRPEPLSATDAAPLGTAVSFEGTVGGVASIAHVAVAGLLSVAPSAFANTENVWLPSCNPVYVRGLVHDCAPPPSSLQVKVAGVIVEWNVNVAVVLVVSAGGALSMTVSNAEAPRAPGARRVEP